MCKILSFEKGKRIIQLLVRLKRILTFHSLTPTFEVLNVIFNIKSITFLENNKIILLFPFTCASMAKKQALEENTGHRLSSTFQY